MKTREIKDRIKSVKNISTITKAMKTVAAVRLRKAQERMLSARPYAEGLEKLLGHLLRGEERPSHSLFEAGSKNEGLLVIAVSSDRGLCGGFNTNVTRLLGEIFENTKAADSGVIAVGRKVGQFMARRGTDQFLLRREGISSTLEPELAQTLGQEAIDQFLSGTVKKVVLVYTRFVSVGRREVVQETLLPLTPLVDQDPQAEDSSAQAALFEPSAQNVMDDLAPRAVKARLWMAFLESVASEMAARMIAMESASKNASDMIDDLTLEFNRARQATITKELAEIVGGAAAMEN